MPVRAGHRATLVRPVVEHRAGTALRFPRAAAASSTRSASSRWAVHRPNRLPASPTVSTRNAPSIRSSAPPRGDGRDIAPPSWRISANSSCEPEPGPGGRDERLDGVRGSPESRVLLAYAASGSSGSRCSRASDAAGVTSNVSISGRSARSGAMISAAARGSPTIGAVDDDDVAAAHPVRQPRERRARGTAAARWWPRPGASPPSGPRHRAPAGPAPTPTPASRRTGRRPGSGRIPAR